MIVEIEDDLFKSRDMNVSEMVDFLYDNGYISKTNDSLYTLSFRGIILKESGGYKQKIISETSENNRVASLAISQHEQGKLLNRLTFWIALGTTVAAIYYLFELFRIWVFPYCHF